MRRVVSALLIASLSACSMVPHYERPAPPVPASWPVGDAYLRQSEASLPAVSYRDIFRDARLQRIIETALANNRDLRVAFANIAAAREQYRIQRAEILPEIGTSASVTEADRGSGAQPGVGNAGGGRRTTYNLQGGITAFEIDLFGRIRALSEAAQNRYFATEAGARATRLTLVGDIANAWLSYAADKDLLAIGEQTVASAQRSVELTRIRLTGGIAPRTDLRQAEQALEQAKADVAQARTDLAQDVNLLQLLAGAPIDPALLPASIAEIEPTIAELPAGLDSTILLRRPDVVQAEYQLRAANAEIGAARAALFPRISLTAVLGFASTALSNLFSGGNFTGRSARRRAIRSSKAARPRRMSARPRRGATPRSPNMKARYRRRSAKSRMRSPGAARSTNSSAPSVRSSPRRRTITISAKRASAAALTRSSTR